MTGNEPHCILCGAPKPTPNFRLVIVNTRTKERLIEFAKGTITAKDAIKITSAVNDGELWYEKLDDQGNVIGRGLWAESQYHTVQGRVRAREVKVKIRG